VYTRLDPRAQAAAELALTSNLKRLDAASRVRGASLEGAVIVAEPNSGDVVAVVGGREVGADGFNRALDARRPIGSLVKPAVYLAAIESGRYNAATLIEDAPIELKLGDGSIWAPQNFEHQTNGPVPMARALAESLNLATVHLGLDIGLPRVADTLRQLGLSSAPALNPSLLLGSVEMTPLEVVEVYTSLANGGFRARLRAVHAVLDEQGRPLRSFKVQVEAAAPPSAVYQLDRMLTLVTTRGTGRDAPPICPEERWSPAKPAPLLIRATAGSRDSPAATLPWCGLATMTTAPPGSPALPERCRCGRTRSRNSSPPRSNP
jgi:penicillin-binding protein 1B